MPRPNINAANTNQYPYWTPPFQIQNPLRISGGAIELMIQDIGVNRIPSETDFLNAPIHRIPVPAINRDEKTAATFESHTQELGRGASIGLTDLMLMSVLENQQIGGNS